MPVTSLTAETAERFKSRIRSLRADARPSFGAMNPLKMMRHMRNVHETALGEVQYPNQVNPYLGKIMFYLFCHLMTTWPKGKIKAPEFWTPTPESEFEEERGKFLEAIDRFTAAHERDPARVVPNPFFGRLSLRQWARLNGIHLDHHLKQFGAA